MLTDKDLKRILDTLLPYFTTKEDLRILKEEIDEKLIAFRSDILSHVDAVYKELLKVREEKAGHFQSHEDINKRLDKIEYPKAASAH